MGENLRCSSDCVSFLNTKFDERYISPSYSVSNVSEQTLQDDRKVKQYKTFECVNGSDSFHMMVLDQINHSSMRQISYVPAISA